MDISLQVAIIGLMGAVVGALISTVIPAIWRDRRAAKEKRSNEKRAARLVADELNTAHALIKLSYDTGLWYSDPDLCNTVTWQKYRSTLAEALPHAQLRSVCDGILALGIIRNARSHHFEQAATFSLTQQERELIEVLGPKVNLALNVITSYTED
jgi:sugar phosphate isomerase/epimerase